MSRFPLECETYGVEKHLIEHSRVEKVKTSSDTTFCNLLYGRRCRAPPFLHFVVITIRLTKWRKNEKSQFAGNLPIFL